MTRRQVLLVGAAGLIMLLLAAVVFAAPAVEDDLRTRAQAALGDIGLTELSIEVSGRDVVLVGTVPDEDSRRAAEDAVAAVAGVRSVETRITLTAPTTSTTTTTTTTSTTLPTIGASIVVTYDNGEATVTGTVATADMRDAVITAAGTAFGPRRVTDELTVEGSGQAPDWLAALEELLAIVAGTGKGRLTADAAGVLLEIRARSQADLDAVLAQVDQVAGDVLTVEVETLRDPLTDQELQEALNDIISQATVTFETDSADLTPEGQDVLDRVIRALDRFPGIPVEIAGHTDSVGTAEYNLELSQRRAEAVLAYLVARGVPEDRLTAVGYGEEQPVADNATEEGRAMNRRIEFVVEGF